MQETSFTGTSNLVNFFPVKRFLLYIIKKKANILLDDNASIKIADFGVSEVLGKSKELIGTPVKTKLKLGKFFALIIVLKNSTGWLPKCVHRRRTTQNAIFGLLG